MLTGLNHITLATSDINRSLEFYVDILGFTPQVKWNKGAYLSLGDLWLCLSKDTPQPSGDYSHIAFSVKEQDFQNIAQKITDSGARRWKDNKSEGASLYFLDPDGHKLEVHVGDLQQRLQQLKNHPYDGLKWL